MGFTGCPRLGMGRRNDILTSGQDVRGVYLDSMTSILPELLQVSICTATFISENDVIVASGNEHCGLCMPFHLAFCSWGLIPVEPEILVVPDARLDARFRENPYTLGDPPVIFYVGAPMVLPNGLRIGNLCLIDHESQHFSPSSAALLCNMADAAVESFLYATSDKMEGAAVMACRASKAGFEILYANAAWTDLTGTGRGDDFLSGVKLFEKHEIVMDRACTVEVLSDTGDVFSLDLHPGNAYVSNRVKMPFWSCSDTTMLHGDILFGRAVRHGSLSTLSASVADVTTEDIPYSVDSCSLLGSGTFGKVYVVEKDSQQLALKVMNTHVREVPLEAFLNAKVSHPNVVKLLDCRVTTRRQESGYAVWILMNLCVNGGLLTAIDTGYFRTTNSFFSGGPHLPRILETASQIAEGMCYVHSHGVVHLDLTCQNILLESDMDAKIADFGLSCVVPNDCPLETDKVGAVAYMPPELLEDGLVSKKVDVYSFGVILFEMYTCRRAYGGMRPGQIADLKNNGVFLDFPEGCPEEYVALTQACMQQDAADRPGFFEIRDRVRSLKELMAAGMLMATEGPVYK